MSLGPPPPHMRPPVTSSSVGLPGAMSGLSLGPPSLSNGVPSFGTPAKPLSTPMPFGAPRRSSPFPPNGPPSHMRPGPVILPPPSPSPKMGNLPFNPMRNGNESGRTPEQTSGSFPPSNGTTSNNNNEAHNTPSASTGGDISSSSHMNNGGGHLTPKESAGPNIHGGHSNMSTPGGPIKMPPSTPTAGTHSTTAPPTSFTPSSMAGSMVRGGPVPTLNTPGGHSHSGMSPLATSEGHSPMGMPAFSTPSSSMGGPASLSKPGGGHSQSGMPTMSTSGGNSSMGLPPSMSTPGGGHSQSRMAPSMSTPGGPSPMGMPPMSTSGGPSPMGMPPMSTSGGPSPMGMPSMSTSGGPSPMGMPPMSTPGGHSQSRMAPMSSSGGPSPMGMPPMSTPGGYSQSGMPPMSSSGGPSPMGMPPMSTSGGTPQMGMPPMSSSGGPSPMGMPPMSTPGGRSPMAMPPMSTPGGLSPMGMPPMSTSGGPSPMGMPPMSSSGGPSPIGMPPMSSSGGPSPMGVPPMSTLGGPPQMGMPPMSSSGGLPQMGGPPMSTPGGLSPMGMPPMSNANSPLGMPPMGGGLRPNPISSGQSPMGMAPPMFTPGRFPTSNPSSNSGPMSTPGRYPPMSTPGGQPMTGSPMPPPMSATPGGFPSGPGGLPPPPTGPGLNSTPHAGGPLRPVGYPGMNAPATPGPGGMPSPMMGGQPGYPQQGQFGAGSASGKRALDPDNMPSPITVMEEDSKNNSGYFDTREKGLVPPLVTTKFVVRDCGNASPRYVRSTMYHIPATPDLMKQCGVPFGLVISPLATIHEGESEPAVTDFGPSGPVRCSRCKAYMCPFMQFIDGGRRFQCIFCKATSEVPQEYFQHLDHNGMRLDHYQRPELCMGTYEVMATKEYCRESVEPLTPGIIFAIDVSYPMIKEGIVSLVCQNMKELLKLLPVDMHCDKAKMKVGFMAYDNKINFYNINGVLTQPQQMTVSDVHDMFVPLVDGFMVDVQEAETVIDALMEQIPILFGETRETETILGPVIQAGKEAFKAAKCAGKLVVFHHNLPICDAPGKLKNRDDRKLLNTEKEKTVLAPQSKFYNELGQECVSVGCSVDLFLFNNAYIDVATMSQVCRLTGGQIYKYTYFQRELDGERFLSDLRHNIQRPVVFDAIMRVRTSTGVRPVDFFGSFFMANSTDTELASINSDMSIACEIKHDDKLTDEDGVYIQIALLFTSCSGQRRLRIMNLSLNTGTNLADMYRSCDLDTIINFTAKQSISRLMESNPKAVKEALINNCAQILACYRKNCASTSSIGQLILPECMKLLPLYTNCLIKSDALVGGVDVGCDERAFLMSLVSSMDVKSSVSFFYPSLMPIHDVDPNETSIPKIIRCSYEKIRDDGVYLLENGLYIFMYIGLGVESSWVRDIFGVDSPAQIDIEKVRFEEARDNPMYKRVFGIIRDLRAKRSRYMRLFFVRPKDKLDVLFKHFLCEDRTGHDGNFSYVDFLCFMHKEIRALLG